MFNIQEDTDGNLKSMLCAIDAVSYSHGRGGEQYSDHFILRDLNKAFTGKIISNFKISPKDKTRRQSSKSTDIVFEAKM